MERRNSWSDDNDLLLAETVLRHVKTGSTQMKAFEEVASKLERTTAACAFRWNSTVRKQYEQAVKDAKEIKQHTKNAESTVVISSVQQVQEETIDQQVPAVIGNTHSFEHHHNNLLQLHQAALVEIDHLRNEVIMLNRKLNEQATSEDLSALMKLIEHARELGLVKNPAV
ncbi:RsfA family transcriptional regulator [Paenibacillus sp. N1-5-1-14]|uniref:RsfA family transcriptional regulator n=1 Tax=Paenibacillus radicibacter TaxID=2972488 RepID=UPI002159AEA3|nr:RsfA family transcriptional regulator [Paenibacillus radicibacter]MCR8641509.1 RsfA family transcriptional regulator [Paenibacillus radicibacter]